jgi:hypothetical protein
MLPRSRSVLFALLVTVALGLAFAAWQLFLPPESKGAAAVDQAPSDDTKGMRSMSSPSVPLPVPPETLTTEPLADANLPPLCDISRWRDARNEADESGVIILPPPAAYQCAMKTGNATLSEELTNHEQAQLTSALQTLAIACARAPSNIPARVEGYNPCRQDVQTCGTPLVSSRIASFVLEARDHNKVKLAKMYYVTDGGDDVHNRPSELCVGVTISRRKHCGPIIALAFTEQGRDRTDAQIALTLAHEWAHAHHYYCGSDTDPRVAAFEGPEIGPRVVELILAEALCEAAERGEYPCQVDAALWWIPRFKLFEAIDESGCCERLELSAPPHPADEVLPDCNCWRR